MKYITYLESCNLWFCPLDEIIEALVNDEGLLGMSNEDLLKLLKIDDKLNFYVHNFDTHVTF